MKSVEIAEIFDSIAQLLEIQQENRFRIRAYERAARNIETIQNLDELVQCNTLETIPGIGKDLSNKIKEYY